MPIPTKATGPAGFFLSRRFDGLESLSFFPATLAPIRKAQGSETRGDKEGADYVSRPI
jgi:hypothetical protein